MNEDSESHSESSFNTSDEDDMDYVINDFNEDAEMRDQIQRHIGVEEESVDSDEENQTRSKKKKKSGKGRR